MRRDNRSYKRRKRSPLFIGITFRLVLTIAAIALVISYLSIFFNPIKFSLPLFFGLYYVPILAINIILLIASLLRRSKSAIIPILAILPSIIFCNLFYKFSDREQEPPKENSIKIESYNVGTFISSSPKLNRDLCRESVINHISNSNPQIACFQEFYLNSKEQLDTLFPNYKYKHSHLFKLRNGKYFGNVILSKYPIIKSGDISFKKSTNLSIYADIKYKEDTIRLYNNHLESYNVSFTSIIKKFNKRENIQGDTIRHDIKIVHNKMRETFKKRSAQVNEILNNIEKSYHPTIICGDFNDTPMSYTYYKLSKNHKDSFRESGSQFGSTFAPLWPLLRIDYILYPKEFSSINHTTHKIKLSDHYPISTEIIIEKK